MDDAVSVVLIGIGGYGDTYLAPFLEDTGRDGVRLAGIVDPFADRSKRVDAIRARGIPLYPDPDAFYSEHRADLAVISSPIHFHAPQTISALEHGSHVLCEKPVAGSLDDALSMQAARDAAERFVAVGYQFSFSPAIRALKRDMLAGVLGEPVRFKTLVLWPRTSAYYSRNAWAGKIRSSSGAWIMDSNVNNATAHYLHNMFFLLGDSMTSAAVPVSVVGETYRANAIENYDTAALKCVTDRGVDVFFYSSHAVQTRVDPTFELELTRAAVRFDSRTGGGIVAEFKDGGWKEYGDPNAYPAVQKMWDCIDCVRSGMPLPCPIDAALSQTICMAGLQRCRDIVDFPDDILVHQPATDGATLTYADGLADTMISCYENTTLPSDAGAAWSVPGGEVLLR